MAGVAHLNHDCPICGRSFNRSEHLKRHLATHSSERTLQCEICGKGFNRRDALQRHEQTHSSQKHRSRKFRACNNCAAARVRCLGSGPCARCLRKSIQCVFPTAVQHEDAGSPSGTSSRSIQEPMSAISQPPDGNWPIPLSENENVVSEATTHGEPMPTVSKTSNGAWPETDLNGTPLLPSALLEMETPSMDDQAAYPEASQSRGLAESSWSFISQTQPQHAFANTATLEEAGPSSAVFPPSQDQSHFHMRQDSSYGIDPDGLGANVMSAFNWLSPTFDFSIENLQYDATQAGAYADSQTAHAVNLAQQWPGESASVAHNPDPSILSDSSYNVSSGDGADGTPKHPLESDGTYYVDGTGARQPRSGKYSKSISGHTDSPLVPVPEVLVGFLFPEQEILFDDARFCPTKTDRGPTMSAYEYEALKAAFQELCIMPPAMFEPYSSPSLPSLPLFNKLIGAYFEHFSPIWPFIHPQSLTMSRYSWLLFLGMASVGAQYVSSCGMRTIVAMHEFLRRTVLRCAETLTSNGDFEQETIIQATFLNCIGMTYSGSTQLEKYKHGALDSLITYFQTKLSRLSTSELKWDNSDQHAAQQWEVWLLGESLRRLAYCIWLLDCMSRYHFRTRPRLLLDHSEIPLPCKEELWECRSSEAWKKIYRGPTVSLAKAVRVLYVEKRLVPGIGDFSRIILIHALLCQTWEVARSLERPLLRWSPTARKEDAESADLTQELWLPKVSSYGRWRNSACDCLDVLHWIANSDIAKSGTENTTVLQLHFARIVLLTPYESIIDMVETFLRGDSVAKAASFDRNRHLIRRWILEDQYKARLSLIHAGVLFWHVRRYSTDAFYEPADIYLATLVLWAYGVFCPPADAAPIEEEGSDSASDPASISSIRLDRPTDDELVQLFVKRGRSMKATINGVGNIAGTKGPLRMLREGCKLLATLGEWSIRDRYMTTLSSLAATYEQSSG